MARLSTYAKRLAGGYRDAGVSRIVGGGIRRLRQCVKRRLQHIRLAELQVRPLFVKAYIKKPLAN